MKILFSLSFASRIYKPNLEFEIGAKYTPQNSEKKIKWKNDSFKVLFLVYLFFKYRTQQLSWFFWWWLVKKKKTSNWFLEYSIFFHHLSFIYIWSLEFDRCSQSDYLGIQLNHLYDSINKRLTLYLEKVWSHVKNLKLKGLSR
jgi:hypothetical protein